MILIQSFLMKIPEISIKISHLKVKTKRLDHHKSMYDNIEGFEMNSPMIITTTTSSSSSSLASSIAMSNLSANLSTLDFGEQKLNMSFKNKYHSCIEPRNLISDTDVKPPLPPKQKKHSKLIIVI